MAVASGRAIDERRKRTTGFTLLELIVVIAIIGILASIVMPQLSRMPRRAQEVALKTDLRTMRDLIDQYYGDKGHYPPGLDDLVKEGYLRKLPVDPVTKSAETWVPVLEEIDADAAPAETDLGEEGQPGVIDVHSGSDKLSLNGTPYSEW